MRSSRESRFFLFLRPPPEDALRGGGDEGSAALVVRVVVRAIPGERVENFLAEADRPKVEWAPTGAGPSNKSIRSSSDGVDHGTGTIEQPSKNKVRDRSAPTKPRFQAEYERPELPTHHFDADLDAAIALAVVRLRLFLAKRV